MSNQAGAQPQTQGSTRYQRIEATCKTIWGASKDFDIDLEGDDDDYYQCFVKEDFEVKLGKTLVCPDILSASSL
jgi:hypothetical protein